MKNRRYLPVLAAVALAAAGVLVAGSVTATPGERSPQAVAGELSETGTMAIGPHATPLDCGGGLVIVHNATRQAGMKEPRAPQEVADGWFKLALGSRHTTTAVVYQARVAGVEVRRDVTARDIGGRLIAALVLTDPTGDGLGVDHAHSCA